MRITPTRITAVILGAIFLLLTWFLYKGDFWTLNTDAQKVDAIVEYASADPEDTSSLRTVLHPEVVFDETIQDRRILIFTDSEIDGLLGEVQFRRGILGGWQPLSASYGAGPVIQSTSLKDLDIRVVYAADCPPEVAHYKVAPVEDRPETVMAEGDVTGPSFFHIYETDRDFFPSLYLYDAQGNLLDSADYLATDQSVPSPGIGSAETNLVYWFCALVLGVGYLIVKYLWDLGTHTAKKEETVP